MARYQAVATDRSHQQHLAFEADSVSEALALLARHRPLGVVELWQEGTLLGRLQHVLEDGASFWRFG